MKKRLNLQIDCDDASEMQKSIFSEIGSDGIRFLKEGLHISTQGLMHMSGLPVKGLLNITSETVETDKDRRLGQGSACLVEEGIYKPLGIKVAVKTLNVFDRNKRHQIMNDIRCLLANSVKEANEGFKCPFILDLYGAFYDNGSLRVALELMDGGSLENIIHIHRLAQIRPKIEEAILARIAVQALCGLLHLHAQNQLHRDIKPGNILLNTKGEVKLSDFGISKQLEPQEQFSRTSVGTRCYMSPERVSGEPYSYASDIWGLGLVFYELGTYQPMDNFHLRASPSLTCLTTSQLMIDFHSWGNIRMTLMTSYKNVQHCSQGKDGRHANCWQD